MTPESTKSDSAWKNYGHTSTRMQTQISGMSLPDTHINDSGKCFYVCTWLNRGKMSSLNGTGSKVGQIYSSREAGETIWIEAATPTAGEPAKPDTVPDFQADGEVYTAPNDSLLLRLLQGMDEKRNRLQSYIDNSIIAPGDLRIIAINAADQKGFGGFAGVFERVLYPTQTKTWGDTDWTWGIPCQVLKGQRFRCPSQCLRKAGISRYHRCNFLPFDDLGYGKSNGGVPLLPQPQ